MPRPFSNYFERLETIYRDRPYFAGLKARLLVIFSWLLIVLVPLNIAKLLWLQPPVTMLRVVFNLCMCAASLLALRLAFKGRLEQAGNALVLVTVVSAHALVFAVPVYVEPLNAAILLFAFDVVFLMIALVFSTRLAAFLVLSLVVVSRITFHVRELSAEPIAGSLKFAADGLLREGLITIGVIFCLGLAMVRMIEAAHLRSEESLRESRLTNENLGRLVAERTRELEAARLRSDEAARAKGDFLANMSHEIRTPLNGIIASADLLRHRSDLPSALQEHVRLIADSGELLLKQLSDILDFSKIEAGQLSLESRRFELAPMVADCVTLLRPKAEQGAVTVYHEVAPELPRHLQGDSFRLRQVLLNLLANAIKFTPPGGDVRLSVRAAALEGNVVLARFEIRDTGIGMDAGTLKRLFERFIQADTSTTRRYGGTGLGLAISARIISMMSGCIEAQSEPGKGSLFYFTIPLQINGMEPAAAAAPARRAASLGLCVLVAEDNLMNRKIIVAQLNELGCVCATTNDGEELLAALLRLPLPDVVLMDCHMPNLDGWEATRRLRAWRTQDDAGELRRQASVLPVIALTAAALPEERARCLDAGMNDFLTKPVKLAELQQALEPFVPAAK